MGLLDGIVGGLVGAGVDHIVAGVIEKHGGIAGLAAQFEQHGLGNVIQSWIGAGPNQGITAEQIQRVLGNETITHFAQKFGIDSTKLTQMIAEHLPKVVNQMTPAGVVPDTTTQVAAATAPGTATPS